MIDRVGRTIDFGPFAPMTGEVVTDDTTLITDTREMVETLRASGMKIGSTTGFTRSIMARVVQKAADQGSAPDNPNFSEDLPRGRPDPLGMSLCLVDRAILPRETVI